MQHKNVAAIRYFIGRHRSASSRGGLSEREPPQVKASHHSSSTARAVAAAAKPRARPSSYRTSHTCPRLDPGSTRQICALLLCQMKCGIDDNRRVDFSTTSKFYFYTNIYILVAFRHQGKSVDIRQGGRQTNVYTPRGYRPILTRKTST